MIMYEEPSRNATLEILRMLPNPLQYIQEATGLNFTLDKKRVAKEIRDKRELDTILAITHEIASKKSTIMDMCANFGDGPRYNPYDIIQVPAGIFGGLSNSPNQFTKDESGFYISKDGVPLPPGAIPTKSDTFVPTSTKKNKKPFTTTIGLWLYNRCFTEPIVDIVGYVNTSMTKGLNKKLNELMSKALLDDKMSVQQLKNYIEQSQVWMSMSSSMSSSHTEAIFAMGEQIAKKKQEIFSRPGMKEKLDAGNLVAMKQVEAELIAYAKELLRDDSAIDMFESNARADYNNSVRNMYLCRSGATQTDGSVKFIASSYMDGMSQDEYTAVADASVGGPFNRSNKTKIGGYLEKTTTLAISHIKMLGEGSDCHTKRYIEVELTDKNKNDWMYSFIISSSGSLIELTPSTIDKYVGKKVKMRYSSLCQAPDSHICEKCGGTLFRRIGFQNIGLGGFIAMSAIKLTSMKSFHDASINLSIIDPAKIFGV